MEKIISIGDKQVGFKATASTIKRYRRKFNRDLLKDIKQLSDKVNNAENKEEEMTAENLEVFERIAYIMAWQYDNSIPNSPDEWLDQFEMFDIYFVLPQIIELWHLNTVQLETPKKKVEAQSEA
jgi:hypothetical protein